MNAREQRRLERAAYHEAGHAVAAYLLGLPIGPVSADADSFGNGTEGHTLRLPRHYHIAIGPETEPGPEEQRQIERKIIVTLAGTVAERLIGARSQSAATQYDHDSARRLAWPVVNGWGGVMEIDAYLKWLLIRAESLERRPAWRPALDALAAALVERRELGGEEAERIIRGALGKENPDGDRQ